MGWASEELSRIDLGDHRLNARSVDPAKKFSDKPTASISATCGDWAETVAAYRFLAQDGIEWRDILGLFADPHA